MAGFIGLLTLGRGRFVQPDLASRDLMDAAVIRVDANDIALPRDSPPLDQPAQM